MTNSRARKLILLVSAVALLAPLTPVPSVNAQGITGPAKCKNGMAGQFPCHKIDLVGHVPAEDMGGAGVADVWGWVDPETKKEYAILGTTNGVQFIDVTDPVEPLYLGRLPLKAPGAC
jgi:hypothetical protein